MTTQSGELEVEAHEGGVSNTDIVLLVLRDLGGAERAVHVEDIAEAAWRRAPARFSWPKLQKYPDLDAVDVTLRAAKKNGGLVAGSKREGWMLTPIGLDRLRVRGESVDDYLNLRGRAGRTDNRRERGGLTSSTTRRLTQLRQSRAATRYRAGQLGEITVHDFMEFFNINQYMPEHKYRTNRQAVENLVRDDELLKGTAAYLHAHYGETYRDQLRAGSRHGIA